MRRQTRCRSAGFAAFTAIVMIGLVAVAIAGLARLTISDAQRTSDARQDAQLRQLLLAGTEQAKLALVEMETDRLRDTTRLPTAPALSDADCTWEAEQLDEQRWHLVVMAELGEREATQRMVVVQLDDGWEIHPFVASTFRSSSTRTSSEASPLASY